MTFVHGLNQMDSSSNSRGLHASIYNHHDGPQWAYLPCHWVSAATIGGISLIYEIQFRRHVTVRSELQGSLIHCLCTWKKARIVFRCQRQGQDGLPNLPRHAITSPAYRCGSRQTRATYVAKLHCHSLEYGTFVHLLVYWAFESCGAFSVIPCILHAYSFIIAGVLGAKFQMKATRRRTWTS